MEMNQSTYSGEAKMAVSQKLIGEKLDQLFIQSDRRQSMLKDCYSISDRLKAIGVSLNSYGHPDNIPQEELSKPYAGVQPTENSVDGLLYQLDCLIASNAEFLAEFNDKVYPALNKNLIYIEKHI